MTHIKRTPRESSFFSLFFCGHSDVLDKLDANSIEKYNLLFLSFIIYRSVCGIKWRQAFSTNTQIISFGPIQFPFRIKLSMGLRNRYEVSFYNAETIMK